MTNLPCRVFLVVGAFWLAQSLPSLAQQTDRRPDSLPLYLPEVRFHLTARPWQPVNAPKSELLDQVDRAMHALAPAQYWNADNPRDTKNGAIIDPYKKVEIQYSTPLFALNVAALLSMDRAADLAEQGARALDRAMLNISTGRANDSHGEFFCAPMVKAIRLFESVQAKYPAVLTAERLKTWKERMKTPRQVFMEGRVRQNWRTFAMKGEWMRQKDGYIADGVEWNEKSWLQAAEGGQRERFRRDLDKFGLQPSFFMYHDDTAYPETFAYNGATTANLLSMLEDGYDGASAKEIRDIVERGLQSSLLLLGGSGEAPAGGRTGEHIWDDTIYALGFELMAEVAHRDGDARMAGEYRHAAQLLFQSHARFQQESGLFSITKNAFHPSLKNRYASWSGLGNYEGFTLACCTEALLARKTEIPEQPTPSEIGGYAVKLDPSFASVFLDAGGMQAQLCTQGETDKYGDVQWHTLGITRFSRTGWDGRLGPGAGHTNPDFSDSVSFAPTFEENGKWTRVSREPKRFGGSFRAEFVHPLLVRGVYTVAPLPGQTGPTFTMRLTLTPDGALVDAGCDSEATKWGMIWPLLAFDGRTVLQNSVAGPVASCAYPPAATPAIVLGAEDARLIGGTTPEFDGGGGRHFEPAGAGLEWTEVDGGEGGSTSIGFQYALRADAKSTGRAKLLVNGSEQSSPLIFPSTGAWEAKHPLSVPVTLVAGKKNTIRLVSEGAENGVGIHELRVHPASASAKEMDQENFLALGEGCELDASAPLVRGGYGDFRPVRVTNDKGGAVATFVYPRSSGDPSAEVVRQSFQREGQDFASVLGRVQGNLYVGRTSAGGEGKAIDLDHDGKDDVTFDQSCAFILQLHDGQVTAVEADRAVEANIRGSVTKLAAFTPVKFP